MKQKLRIRYGILDGFGEVVRWSWNRPSDNYRYITERVRLDTVIDFDAVDPALF